MSLWQRPPRWCPCALDWQSTLLDRGRAVLELSISRRIIGVPSPVNLWCQLPPASPALSSLRRRARLPFPPIAVL